MPASPRSPPATDKPRHAAPSRAPSSRDAATSRGVRAPASQVPRPPRVRAPASSGLRAPACPRRAVHARPPRAGSASEMRFCLVARRGSCAESGHLMCARGPWAACSARRASKRIASERCSPRRRGEVPRKCASAWSLDMAVVQNPVIWRAQGAAGAAPRAPRDALRAMRGEVITSERCAPRRRARSASEMRFCLVARHGSCAEPGHLAGARCRERDGGREAQRARWRVRRAACGAGTASRRAAHGGKRAGELTKGQGDPNLGQHG